MPDQRLEFCSAEWIDAANRHFAEVVRCARQDLHDVRWRWCETLTDAPRRLSDMPDGSVSWHIIVDGAESSIGPGVIVDPDYSYTSDYSQALRHLRTPREESPELLEELRKHVAENPASAVPIALAPLLADLQAYLSGVTA